MRLHSRILRCGFAGFISASLIVEARGTAESFQIRDADGAAACVVTTVDDNASRLIVDVRAPASPDAATLARLPESLRDFSTMPMRVLLIAPAGASSSAPRQQMPTTLDGTLFHPSVNGSALAAFFVRSSFPRAALAAGVEILGERMATATTGERITTQTRCRITEADANNWR